MRAQVLFLCLALSIPGIAIAQEASWPRTFGLDGIDVVVHQPQVDRWVDYQVIEARAAVVVRRPERPAAVGALSVVADTLTDHEAGTVVLENILVTGLRFPEAPAGEAAELRRVVEARLPTRSLPIEIERVTAMVAENGAAVRQVEANLDPPPIFFSTSPAVLVVTLGEPELQRIGETGLFFVTNTNWDLIRDAASERYYLRVQRSWLEARGLVSGSWQPVAPGSLPKDFASIPSDEDWSEVRAAIPGERLGTVPRVFVSAKPAELVQTDGAPKYRPVAGTSLLQVENTRSDLFYHGPDGIYFLLTSGRWFKAFSLSGPWSAATEDLPEDFRAIPESDAASRVLASVPGTVQAEEAVLQAQLPTTASVDRDQVPSRVSYDGDPQFIAIEDIGVSFAGNSPQDVFLVDGRYYLCSQGIWFVAPTATGPWTVADSVPARIYAIPSTHPKHNVTYVYVYDSTPDTVVVGYTSGYSGSYVVSGVVMFGLGWWLWDEYWDDHWWWHPHHYHYHYHHHWYGYGGGHWYDHHHGVWRREGWAYGPYGGIGGGSWYDPHTGAWARRGAAWGPYQARGFASGYDPRTDTYAARVRGANAYEHWGRGVVARDDKWARTGHYGNERGTIGGIRTSEGGRAIVGRGDDRTGGLARTGEGDLYAGRDGNVYRRQDGQWQAHGEDGWRDVSSSRERLRTQDGGRADTLRDRAGSRPDERPAPRESRSLQERLQAGESFDRDRARDAAAERGFQGQTRQGSSSGGAWTPNLDTRTGLDSDARARDRASRSLERSRSTGRSRSDTFSGSSSRRSSSTWSSTGGSRSRPSAGSRSGGGRRTGGGRRR